MYHSGRVAQDTKLQSSMLVTFFVLAIACQTHDIPMAGNATYINLSRVSTECIL